MAEKTGASIGFCQLLTLVFIVLKLTNVIAWSWWWVLSPLWIPLCIFAIAVVFTIVIAICMPDK